jgi:hypothetical protein
MARFGMQERLTRISVRAHRIASLSGRTLCGLAVVALLGLPSARAAEPADELVPLAYNHPGLTVDLGVGLWAWPVVWDVDGDGDYDLIVSCPDKPFNGVWVFENTSGDTAQHKFPIFKTPRKISHTVHYVMPSYVDDQLRVLVSTRISSKPDSRNMLIYRFPLGSTNHKVSNRGDRSCVTISGGMSIMTVTGRST